MRPLEWYSEKADELAQEVVNAWGVNVRAGNASSLSHEFKVVFEKACRYRTTRKIADNHRQFGRLSETDAAEEKATRRAFAEAYQAFYEKCDAASLAIRK